ncbi:MAG: VOC family protein [Pseudomonadales bacterium]|nr:VOC family protein [Pseudomonadales bacterium]
MLAYIKFAELPVLDQDRAVAFYTDKLGLQVVQDAPYQEGWRWIELALPGAQTRLLLTRQREEKDLDAPRLVLVVESVEVRYRQLCDKGVLFTQAPTRAPWKPDDLFAQFRDSEGNGIVISEAWD